MAAGFSKSIPAQPAAPATTFDLEWLPQLDVACTANIFCTIVQALTHARPPRCGIRSPPQDALHQVQRHWRGIAVTLFVNWAVKSFSMALLGWILIRHVFAAFLPAQQLDSYIAGLILLARGEAIMKQPLIIAMLAVPILIQVFLNAALASWLNRRFGESHAVACPSALIGASNFLELAVAAAGPIESVDGWSSPAPCRFAKVHRSAHDFGPYSSPDSMPVYGVWNVFTIPATSRTTP